MRRLTIIFFIKIITIIAGSISKNVIIKIFNSIQKKYEKISDRIRKAKTFILKKSQRRVKTTKENTLTSFRISFKNISA